nr:neuronal acetylcholine receptor subunit alpha-7-like [Lepeophtheirus salmonis]XP_040565967.1 neuronal acetylcholine receptor subunit alpha-7-like [Lepeophtheirus salmonis]
MRTERENNLRINYIINTQVQRSIRMNVIMIIIVMVYFSPTVFGGQTEKKVLNFVFNNYNILERPVRDPKEPVQLSMGVSLRRIIGLDEKNQILTANLWITLIWKDHNLHWNRSEYPKIERLQIPTEHVWTPDILLYNSASTAFNNFYHVNLLLSNEGEIRYMPPGIIQSTCEIDITWFPFDEQNCTFKFGSWTHDGNRLNLSMMDSKGDLTNFETSVEWEVLGMPAIRTEDIYDCCKDKIFQDITYTIQLRRRTLYYLGNWTLPCVLIASMAILGFYFPPESGEKITLEITILMSLTFFMNMVTDMQPPSSKTPLVGIYFSCIMIMIASSVICSILVINYHHRLTEYGDMPKWFRFIFFKVLPKILLMSFPNQENLASGTASKKSMEMELEDLHSDAFESSSLKMEDLYSPVPDHCPVHKYNIQEIEEDENSPQITEVSCLDATLHDILIEIQVITNKIEEQDFHSEKKNEWKLAAMVLDRFCLITFTLLTILLTAAVVIASPQVIVW